MRYDRLTIKSQEAIQQAVQQAVEMGHAEVMPLHLLQTLLADPEGMAQALLEKLGIQISVIN
jgi:ATP-dependent Clp protease ATP-binding subunit ClpB